MAEPAIDAILEPALVDVLDKYIREEEPKLSRSEALAAAFRDWAIHMGYLPATPSRNQVRRRMKEILKEQLARPRLRPDVEPNSLPPASEPPT